MRILDGTADELYYYENATTQQIPAVKDERIPLPLWVHWLLSSGATLFIVVGLTALAMGLSR